jgi:hypothetical protein
MLSRNLYILAGTLLFFSIVAYVMALTGFAHEPGTPSDESLWRTIGIILLLLALVTALFGVLQHMFEQTDRRTPGGQAAVHRQYVARKAAMKAMRNESQRNRGRDRR